MALRNIFDRPKRFAMPNQGRSSNQLYTPRETEPMERYFTNAGPPETRPPENDWDNWMSELREVYTKEGPAASAYRQHLSTMPQYQQPTKMNRVGAALVGVSEGLRSGGAAGFQAAQEATQAPYRRALDEWGLKEQALSRDADFEDKMSGRRIEFMQQARQLAKDDREYRKWMDEFDFKKQQEINDENQRTAEREHWKSQGWKEYTDDQGNLHIYHPGQPGSDKVMGPTSKKTDWTYESGRLKASQRSNEISAGSLQVSRDRETRLASAPMGASNQSDARASAAARAELENPGWDRFVTPEGSIQRPRDAVPGTVKGQEFDNFIHRVEEIEDDILTRPRYQPNVPIIR